MKISELLNESQGVAEGSEQKYLWHGSRQKIPMLEPRQAVDTGGAAGSNQNAIYATSDPIFATQMGMPAAGSDYGHFPNDPQMVLFSGKIRKGENVYLHKLPFYGPNGKPQFVQGGNDREFHSIPGVKAIKPVEIKAVPVDRYLNLVRQATPQDLELRKELTKEGVAEEQLGELSRDTLKSYVPKRIEKTQGMLAKEFDKSKRIIKKDLPRAMAKLKDPTYGKAKPTSESMAGVGMEPHAREQSMMMRGYAGGESMGDAGGAVIATYTIYDRHDRKMVKSRKFNSEDAAQAWAHRNNAIIVKITPFVKESADARPEYALLANGNVIYKYKDSGEAESNLRLLRNKFPQQNFELKQEVCTLQPIGENVIQIGESYEAEMAKAIRFLERK